MVDVHMLSLCIWYSCLIIIYIMPAQWLWRILHLPPWLELDDIILYGWICLMLMVFITAPILNCTAPLVLTCIIRYVEHIANAAAARSPRGIRALAKYHQIDILDILIIYALPLDELVRLLLPDMLLHCCCTCTWVSWRCHSWSLEWLYCLAYVGPMFACASSILS